MDGAEQVGIVSWVSEIEKARYRKACFPRPRLFNFVLSFSIIKQGNGCGHEEFPGVYARVSNAIDFIEDSVCNYSDCPPKSCKEDPKGSYRVDVQYDAWPEDIEWEIFSKDEDEAIVSSAGGEELFELVSVYIDLGAGEYVFRIADSSGYKDGMTVDMEGMDGDLVLVLVFYFVVHDQ